MGVTEGIKPECITFKARFSQFSAVKQWLGDKGILLAEDCITFITEYSRMVVSFLNLQPGVCREEPAERFLLSSIASRAAESLSSSASSCLRLLSLCLSDLHTVACD